MLVLVMRYASAKNQVSSLKTGMMEGWNLGMMGLKVFYRFYIKPYSALIPNIPFFHHSTIPYGDLNPVIINLDDSSMWEKF